MEKVKIEDSLGMVIGHDLTKIIPGEYKGAAFKKGHIVNEKDIYELKKIGKNHIYVVSITDGYLHEDECAVRIGQAVSGEGVYIDNPSEGKVNIKSNINGILKINLDSLYKINSINSIVLSTVHTDTVVDKGTLIAGTKVIPLILEEKYINEVENICKSNGPILWVKPFKSQKVGIIVTGTEVFEGLIEDKFAKVILEKLQRYDCEITKVVYSPDDLERIQYEIQSLINSKVDIIVISGGMSVDPDDVTPTAIKDCCDEVISYGTPVLPGAMFMLAYSKNTAIMGLPACGMFSKTTVFDLVLPRIMAKDDITKDDIVKFAHGGLCLKCETCNYPICPFGK
jgi:molybdenum cofactor synthesis domain-containing protein